MQDLVAGHPVGLFQTRASGPDAPGAHASAKARTLRRRSIRVIALTVAVMLMSFGDLYMTLTHLKGIGMAEGNPVARLVMEYNSTTLLSAWKTASIVLACLVFLIARTRVMTEVACWFCVLVLLALTCKWIYYSSEITALTPTLSAISQSDSADWVSISETDGR